MSNFTCEYCGTDIIDGPNGFVTECIHYPKEPYVCAGCKYDKPGDCAARTLVDGCWYRFPDGNCYEPMETN